MFRLRSRDESDTWPHFVSSCTSQAFDRSWSGIQVIAPECNRNDSGVPSKHLTLMRKVLCFISRRNPSRRRHLATFTPLRVIGSYLQLSRFSLLFPPRWLPPSTCPVRAPHRQRQAGSHRFLLHSGTQRAAGRVSVGQSLSSWICLL